MNLSNCLHPLIVRNRFTGELTPVPCGKCVSCRSQLNNKWTIKLEQERQCWPYCVFFTLTYSDEFVPRFNDEVDFSEFEDYLRKFCRYHKELSYADEWFFAKRWYESENRFVCRTEDAQKFIKRLRYYITQLSNYKYETEQVRYYVITEYGESSFRPHIHGLLFFKSETIKTEVLSLISKAWKFGIVDVQFAREGCANYCASYLSTSCGLPAMFGFPAIASKRLYSRRPALGSLLCNDSYVRKIFETAAIKEDIYIRRNNTFVSLPLRPSLKNRLFPRIKGFSDFTHVERSELYRTAAQFSDFEHFTTFFTSVFQESYIPKTYFETLLYKYVRTNYEDIDFVTRCLSRLYNVSKRVLLQSNLFNLTVDSYVKKIEEFYNKVAYAQLVGQYRFQSDYVKDYDCKDLVAMYPLYLSDLVKGVYTDNQFDSLRTFGYDLDKDFDTAAIHTLDSSKVFRKLELDAYWRVFNNSKTKHFKAFYRAKYNNNLM